MEEVHMVSINGDATDIEGLMERDLLFKNLEHAKNWVQAQPDPYGNIDRRFVQTDATTLSFGHMLITTVPVITEDIADLAAAREVLKQKTLAAMTTEERIALGFGDWTPDSGDEVR